MPKTTKNEREDFEDDLPPPTAADFARAWKAAGRAPTKAMMTRAQKATSAPRKKTRTVAGHRVTLNEGIRYVAKRPGAFDPHALNKQRKKFDVTISVYANGYDVLVIPDLSYDDANAFLKAFNNGLMSFDGRVW